MYVGIFCIFNRSAHDGASLEADHKTPNRGCPDAINKYCLIHYKPDCEISYLICEINI